jgi:hypothetical protein
MDQLKVAYKHAREHWFWIACGVIFLFGLVIWFWVTSSIAGETTQRHEDIRRKFSTASSINQKGVQITGRSNPFHPNEITHVKMREEIAALKASVLKAWLEQHKSQGDAIFAWTAALPDVRDAAVSLTNRERKDAQGNVIKDESGNPIKVRVPIEAITTAEAEAALNINLRTTYGLYIQNELPKLAERIHSNWGASTTDGSKAIVQWNTQNQQSIANAYFNWSGQEHGAPTAMQVLYSQEDLRVIEAILDVIADTNRDATADFNAAIKRIDSIQWGRDAASRSGQIMRLGAAPTTAPMAGQPAGVAVADVDEDQGDGNEQQPGGAKVVAAAADPADRRYVDLNYEPLPAAALRASFVETAAAATDQTKAKLAVAKRLPVRLRLSIDQRKLHRLLAACANSPLTIEVRQVRINPAGGEAAAPGAPRGNAWGQAAPEFEPEDGEENSQFENQGNRRPPAAGATVDKNTLFDINLELYGVVYIYNPVDLKNFDAQVTAAPPPAMAAVSTP